MTSQTALKRIYQAYSTDPAFAHLRGPGVNVVPGRGSMEPLVVIVGEAPGVFENHKQKPFLGPAGRVLDHLLSTVGLDRSQVFVTNTVKYRPARNRTPWPSEIKASRPYLLDELACFPGVPVVTLGVVALRALLTSFPTVAPTMGDWHGRRWHDDEREYLALYHPAFAIYDPSNMDTVLTDFRIVTDLLSRRVRS